MEAVVVLGVGVLVVLLDVVDVGSGKVADAATVSSEVFAGRSTITAPTHRIAASQIAGAMIVAREVEWLFDNVRLRR